MTRKRCRDEGSALVEFVYLGVLLLVPLVYVVLTAVTVQRNAFGVTTAARDAGRAYATAGSDGLGERRAEAAVRIAMHDQGIDWSPDGRVIRCDPCDYAPGSQFTVSLHSRVPLPLVPAWLCGRRCLAGIGVSADHTERLSCYSGASDATADSRC
jgi:hypothetical protein